LEKEKQAVKSEVEDLAQRVDHVNKGKAAAEKLAKQLEQQLSDLSAKIDEEGAQDR
jgi:ABC-type hemin transport system substrate-binding protein